MVFAAIDIGSNAVRLLISDVCEENQRESIRKGSLIRVPVRLGDDVFTTGMISEEKAEALVNAMRAFRHHMNVRNPVAYLACATSAVREAQNGREVMDRIRRETGIGVEIIDGSREAEIVYSSLIAEGSHSDGSSLYIEVGGGSSQLTLFSKSRRIASRSFAIGTIRLLTGMVEGSDWNELRAWIEGYTRDHRPLTGIGSGGNINFLFKMSRKKEGHPLGYRKIMKMRRYIESFSLEDRMKTLGLRPDRADVILPACEIYLSIMKWAGITRLTVPNVRLVDGMIHYLAERRRSNEFRAAD